MTILLINTRPNPTPMPLLAEQGIVVRALPLLEICPCQIDEVQKLYEIQLINGDYKLLMAVSPMAVEIAVASLGSRLEIVKNLNKTNQLKIIAVGKATANALKKYGLIAHCPDDNNANNEGMLALPEVNSLKNKDKVLIWAGVGGRTLFLNTLQEKGIIVHKIEYYQRLIPKNLIKTGKQVLADKADFERCVVLITSGQAWEHWQRLCDELALPLDAFCYVTMGERLAKMIVPCAVKAVFDLSEPVILSILREFK